MLRDQVTENQVKAIMNTQISDKEKISRSDFVIHNDDKELVIPKVLKLHNELLKIIK
jgi:dephospho-CoA kinase